MKKASGVRTKKAIQSGAPRGKKKLEAQLQQLFSTRTSIHIKCASGVQRKRVFVLPTNRWRCSNYCHMKGVYF